MRIKVAKSPYECLWSHVCGGAIISVATTPNCSLIAAASVDCKLYLLNRDGILLWNKPLDNEAWAVDISADGSRIAVGTANKKPADGTVYVYNQDGTEIFQCKIGSPVWGVSLSGDGAVLAVTSWNNKAYRFIEKTGTYYLEHEKKIGIKGLYGVSLSADGAYCAISSYEDALLLLDNAFTIVKKFPITTGLYGAKLSPDASFAVAGCRDGHFLSLPNLPNNAFQLSPQISPRPICGISLSDDGKILALGSFDGRVYVTSAQGRCLWIFETDGEVWSTAMAADGSLICVGSGDQTVYLLHSLCNSTVLKEIEAVETVAEKTQKHRLKTELNNLMPLYLRCGLLNYGLSRLRELVATDLGLFEEITQEFLLAIIHENPTCYEAQYYLARLFRDKEDWTSAVRHYQEAANDPIFRYSALNAAGECFSKLGWETAALSCFHRTREQYLDREGKKVIYNLALSYEDSGYFEEAIKHYQLLLSWDVSYRNVLERLRNLSISKAPTTLEERRSDYTGLTVSLLGPDIPRVNEVDEKLITILKARTKELFVVPGERARMQKAIDVLISSNSLPQGFKNKSLDYDRILYLKYDYSLPEDEIKKQLEMVNFLSTLEVVSQFK
ncbi:MAG: PQQ-binding-like beta-propeller repeat protein, partial [Thermoplasmatales archaeon]|nr:PQQ-binding-like beta-propeller repeat protein [Thermoplasmatales archaeon]